MGSVTGYTKERMQAIEAGTVVSGVVSGDDLILTRHDGVSFDAGHVRGATGAAGSGIVEDSMKELLSPIGGMKPFGGNAAPTGWLICDGTSKLRSSYPGLYAVIGVAYGAADSTQFNVPDLRLRVPIGKTPYGLGYVLGAHGGSKDAVVVVHSHNILPIAFRFDGSSEVLMLNDGTYAGHYATGVTFSTATTTDSAGVSETDANMPPYVVVNWIIRY